MNWYDLQIILSFVLGNMFAFFILVLYIEWQKYVDELKGYRKLKNIK